MKRKLSMVLPLLWLIASSALCQSPRPPRSVWDTGNLWDLRMWLKDASLTRTVTVDQAGFGDFLDIKSACDWVAAQPRSVDAEWLVDVSPGLYNEQPFVVPAHVIVQGRQVGHDRWGVQPQIRGTNTSGTFITLQGQMANLFLTHDPASLTASATVIAASGFYFGLTEITALARADAQAHEYRILDVGSGTFGFAHDIYLGAAFSATNGTMIRIEPGSEIRLSDSHLDPVLSTWSRGVWAAGASATARLLRTKLGPVGSYPGTTPGAFTEAIRNDGGHVVVSATLYDPASVVGSLTFGENLLATPPLSLQGCLLLSGSGAPAVAAPACSLYLDSAGGKLYVKESGTGTSGWVLK